MFGVMPVASAEEEVEPARTESEHTQSVRRETLTTLLAKAEKNYPRLLADKYAIEAAEHQLKEATYSPFFQWNATAAMGLAPGFRGTPAFSRDSQLPLGNDWNVTVGWRVEGAIPLFTFGKLRNLRKAAQAGVSVSKVGRERSLAELRSNVRKAYFGALLGADLLYLSNEAEGYLSAAQEQLEEKEESDDEESDPNDGYRLKAAATELKARKAQVERLYASSIAALQTLVGEKSTVVDCPLEKLAWQAPDKSSQLLESAATSRPELRMLAEARLAKEAQVGIERGRLLPDLALVFYAGSTHTPHITDQNNPFVYDPANQPSLGAALALRWSLDFVGQTFRLKRVQAEAKKLDAQIEEAKRGVQLQTKLAYQSAVEADKRERAWRDAVKASRAWLVASAQGYQLGTTEAGDLIDALTKHMEQRASHLQATMEYNVSLSELEKTTGVVLVPDEAWPTTCEDD